MKKDLRLSPDKKLTGLCGGIGEFINIDPNLVRLLAVAIALLTAVIPSLIVYFVLSLVFPPADEDYYTTHPIGYKKVYRSPSDKRIFGVCGGIGEAFCFSSVIVRLVWAVSVLVFGFGGLLYLAAAVILPSYEPAG